MATSSRIGVFETFRPTSSTARLPGGIFQNVRNFMQRRCPVYSQEIAEKGGGIAISTMNTQYSRKVIHMQVSGTKHHRRCEFTQNACGRCLQLKTTIKGGTEAQLKTFAANGSTAVRKVGGDHPRRTTAVDERYIILLAKRARYQSRFCNWRSLYKEIIIPHVSLFRGAIGQDFVFMVDNARSHWTADVQLQLEREDITRMDWPTLSLHLNPMEYV
ncbi:hypothetical protein TNCV_320971 [Trichonephila clavipes]|nr:hypothetical protein TNCV_320971 [Trichonephila clavipes]